MIQNTFSFLAIAFNKIPFLSKLEGYRSVVGFIGMGIIQVLKLLGKGDPATLDQINIGLIGFTGLALNAKVNK